MSEGGSHSPARLAVTQPGLSQASRPWLEDRGRVWILQTYKGPRHWAPRMFLAPVGAGIAEPCRGLALILCVLRAGRAGCSFTAVAVLQRPPSAACGLRVHLAGVWWQVQPALGRPRQHWWPPPPATLSGCPYVGSWRRSPSR